MSRSDSIESRVQTSQFRATLAVTACTLLVGTLVGIATSLRADDDVSLAVARTVGSEIGNHPASDSTALEEVVRQELGEQAWFGRPTEVWRAGRRLGSTQAAWIGPAPAPGCVLRFNNGEGWHVCTLLLGDGTQVSVASAVRPIVTSVLRVVGSIAAAGLLTLLALVSVSRKLVRRSLAPLDELGRLIDEMSQARAAGNLGRRWGVVEVDGLAGAFDSLLQRIARALQRERRFLADASHELKTPLSQIRAQLERVQAGLPAGSEAHARVSRAVASNEQLVRIVESVLTLARSEVPAGEAVNLRELVADLASAIQQRDPEDGRRLEIDGADEALVRADPTLLSLAVGNLVENALKFSTGSVRVVIASGDPMSVAVDDAGPGIPERELADVIQPFVRGSEPGAKGVGLGLALSHHVAQAYAGELVLGRSPRGGLKVSLTLPPWAPRAN